MKLCLLHGQREFLYITSASLVGHFPFVYNTLEYYPSFFPPVSYHESYNLVVSKVIRSSHRTYASITPQQMVHYPLAGTQLIVQNRELRQLILAHWHPAIIWIHAASVVVCHSGHPV